MNRYYLLKLDDIIRSVAKTVKGNRDFTRKVNETCASLHLACPSRKLLRMRTFRILTNTELDKVFGKANFLVSFNDIQSWKSMSITKLLKEASNAVERSV